MGVAQSDGGQVRTLLFKLRLMFAQLRDVLTAEDSTVVAKEDDYCWPLGPQRSELDGLAVHILERDGGKTRADGRGHGAAILMGTKICVNASQDGATIEQESKGGHMQVVFSIEEFRLLVHALRECSESDSQPTPLQKSATDLLEKILARDFGFSLDELDDLETILQGKEKEVRKALEDPACTSLPEVRHEEEVLEHVIDRVTEACAMG